jgi:hypothetical protein
MDGLNDGARPHRLLYLSANRAIVGGAAGFVCITLLGAAMAI